MNTTLLKQAYDAARDHDTDDLCDLLQPIDTETLIRDINYLSVLIGNMALIVAERGIND